MAASTKEIAILKAIESNRWNVALDLIKKNKELSFLKGHGLSPLHLFLECNAPVDIVRKLLACGVDDVNQENGKTGMTPLATALAQNPSVELVQLLLEAGASVNEPKTDGFTLLHLAVQGKASVGVLKALKHAGANHMATDKDGLTPFDIAIFLNADVKVIEWFIKDLHCDPNSVLSDEFERRALSTVVPCNACPRVDLHLKTSGENMNRNGPGVNGFTPLHAAVGVKASPETLRLLIEGGGNPNVQMKNGSTPIFVAAQSNAPVAIMQLLIDAGGDVTIPGEDQYLPIDVATMANVDPELMRLIIRAGGDVNKLPDGPGRRYSALHLALQKHCSPALLSVMLSDGHGDPNLVSGPGLTPIHTGLLSTPIMSIDMLALLIEAGADANSVYMGQVTPPWLAVKRGANPSLIEMLVLSGATLNNRGQHILRWAIEASASKDMIGTLIACGADLYVVGAEGENLSEYARQHGRKDLEELLNRPDDFMTCAGCYQHAPNLSTCAGCNIMAYCDRQCQKAHWTRSHKRCCKMCKKTGASSS